MTCCWTRWWASSTTQQNHQGCKFLPHPNNPPQICTFTAARWDAEIHLFPDQEDAGEAGHRDALSVIQHWKQWLEFMKAKQTVRVSKMMKFEF